MTKFKVALSLALGVLLASCGGQKGETRTLPPDALTIHAASDQPVEGWNRMQYRDASKGEIWVEPTPALTLSDIRDAAEIKDEMARPAISVRFSSGGAEKMRKFTREHIGKMAAIVFDGKVLNAPSIRSEISEAAVITTGGAGVSAEETQLILQTINQ